MIGMASIIVGAVGVLVRPVAKGITKSVENSLSGAPAIAEKVGRSMGRSMNRAFTASKPVSVDAAAKNLERAQDSLAAHTERSALRQRKAQQDVAKARKTVADVATTSSEKVAKAQESVETAERDLARIVEQSARDQEDAKRKVASAESDLARTVEQSARDQAAATRRVDDARRDYTDTVAKYGAESDEARTAAARLKDAEDQLAKTVSDGAARQERAKDKLADAQSRLVKVTEDGALKQERAQKKVTDAQDAYSRAVEESGKDSDAARKAADELALAEENLKTAAEEAAQGHETLTAEVAEAKRALDEAERSSRGLSKMWDSAKDFGADYKGMGQRLNKAIGPKVWKGIKWGALGVAGVLGGTLVASLKKGWDRLTGIENAESKLTGLGHSAENVSLIMDDALAAVKGTAFGMDEAATAAASAVAAGIEPGKDLERYLSLVGDAATIAGSDLTEMGSIFGKVAAKGRLSGDVLNQMTERGISLLPELAEHYGVTNAEAEKMVSDGKVSFEDFAEVMENTLGGAALDAGNTTQGAFKNMGAAMGRFGAAILKDIYPLVGPLFGKVTELFDYLTDWAGPAVESLVERLKPFAESLKNVFDLLVTGDFKGGIFGLEEDSPVIGFLFTMREVALELWEKALKPLGAWIGQNWPVIAAAVGGLVAYLSGSMIIAAIGTIGAALGGLLGSATVIGGAISVAVGAITGFFTQTEKGRDMLGRFVEFVTGTLWPGIVGAFTAVKDFVVNEFWPMLKSRFEAFRDLIVQVWEGVVQPAFERFVGFLQDVLWPIVQRVFQDYIGPLIVAVWEGVIKPAMAALDDFIGNVLGPVIVWLWENVVSPIFSFIGAYIEFTWNNIIFPALDALKYFVLEVLPPAFQWLSETVSAVWSWIRDAISAVVAWFRDTAWPVVSAVIDWLVGAFTTMRDAVGAAWAFVRDSIIAPVVNWFQTWVWPVIDMVLTLIKIGFNAMRDVLKAAWAFVRDRVIQPVVAWFRDTAWPILDTVLGSIKTGFNVMRDALKAAWAFVRDNVIRPVVSWFRDTAWPAISSVIDSIKTGFNVMRDALKAAWGFVKDKVIAPVANWFRDTIAPLFDRTTDGIGDAFSTMKDAVKKAWDAMRDTAKAPIKFVVDTVLNDALIGNFNKVAKKLGTATLPTISLPRGFARGGILPGSSSWRDGDDQLVSARRGEGWMVSEGLRDATSRSLFLAANHAARTRGTSFAEYVGGMQGFRLGGIVDGVKGLGARAKELAGHALDKVMDGLDFVAEAIKDPKSMFTKVYDAVIGEIPAAGLVTSMAKGAGSKILSGIVDAVLGAFGPGSDAAVGPVPAGANRSLGYAQQVARSFGLTMTSFRRAGARTAGTGSVSYHALGRAMDFSNGGSPTPQMMAFFNAMHPLRPTELLYSPARGRQWRRWGAQQDTSGATKRMHYNHVHVAFNKGGILGDQHRPMLFDQGGVLPPGLHGVLNATRKPEAVLTNEQLQQLRVLTDRGTAAGDTFMVYAQNDKAAELVSELMWAQKTRQRRGRYATAGR